MSKSVFLVLVASACATPRQAGAPRYTVALAVLVRDTGASIDEEATIAVARGHLARGLSGMPPATIIDERAALGRCIRTCSSFPVGLNCELACERQSVRKSKYDYAVIIDLVLVPRNSSLAALRTYNQSTSDPIFKDSLEMVHDTEEAVATLAAEAADAITRDHQMR